MAGSGVCSIDAADSPPRRPTATYSSARALNSEQAKRRRAHRSSPGVLTLQERTLLESIDESSEDKSYVATTQSYHQLSMQFTCRVCGEAFPRQVHLDHHIKASHAAPRSDVPRVVCADYGLSEDVDELLYPTAGKLPGDFFRPPTLGDPAVNDSVIEGWRAAALPAVLDTHDERGAVSKPHLKPSVFTAKLEEHHAPRLGPRMSASDVRPPPYPRIFWGTNGTINGQDKVEPEGKQKAGEEGDDHDHDILNKNDANYADDADDNDVYGQTGEYLSSTPAYSAEPEKKIASPRVLPSPLWSSANPRQYWANRRFPSIDSIISDTATFKLETPLPSPLKPAVVRQPLIDDDEFSPSCMSGDTSLFSEISPVLP
ncbi:hypothetical protein E4U55_002396 [Claviceps digitariae]|nr:hypothetical protein E4U55_002396 [Claviceps digitariae]